MKETVGDATDNERMEREGRADQVEGKAEGAKGHLKDAGDKVKEGLKDAFDRD